jgi:predicted enzyme related to lactoylglutathione lyase
MFKRIKFASVPVRNPDQALEFWTQVVGLQVATDQPMGDGRRWIELKMPGAQTGLALFTPLDPKVPIGTFQNLAFTVDDLERTYGELKARGVEFVQPPTKAGWGFSAIFKDVDGNSFLIGE